MENKNKEFNITFDILKNDRKDIENYYKNIFNNYSDIELLLNYELFNIYDKYGDFFEKIYSQEHSEIIKNRDDLVLLSTSQRDIIYSYYKEKNGYEANKKYKDDFIKSFIDYFLNSKKGTILRRKNIIKNVDYKIIGDFCILSFNTLDKNINDKNKLKEIIDNNIKENGKKIIDLIKYDNTYVFVINVDNKNIKPLPIYSYLLSQILNSKDDMIKISIV